MTTTRETASFRTHVTVAGIDYAVRGWLDLIKAHGSERLEHFGACCRLDHSELIEVELGDWTASPLPLDNGHWGAIMEELEERRFDLARP